jgi:hypothetical protein
MSQTAMPIEHALRNGRTLVPVLIDNTPMPSTAQLPESLKAIGRTNAVKLRDDDWDADVAKLERMRAHRLSARAQAAANRACRRR